MSFLKRLFGKKKESPSKKQPVSKTKTTKKDDEETNAKTTTDAQRKYHVSMNKDEKSEHYKTWRVRKESSNKTIKYFNTQKEAIEYAEELAAQAGTSVVIHKMDGSIRKQNYKPKA
ncbi:DUF2188 domain-containing protein [Liberiplasma polymorphum]|uniref:DUF2188 domain-containing protein n=1 Tax=Liberiplasma polymorphum TaxID=3374570 RepID=UPI0037713453